MNCDTSSHHFRQCLHITFLPAFVLKNLLPARATESQGSSSPGPDGIGLELNTSDILDYSLKIMQSGIKIMKSMKRGFRMKWSYFRNLAGLLGVGTVLWLLFNFLSFTSSSFLWTFCFWIEEFGKDHEGDMQDSYYVLLSHTWYDYSNNIGWVITPRRRVTISLSVETIQ